MFAGISKPPIRILHMMARTGGTVICKCLGSMDSIVLLSEIHPAVCNPSLNALEQAHIWFDLLTPKDVQGMREKSGVDFGQDIFIIYQRCIEKGKMLVIRDWSHIDFTGFPYMSQPSYKLTTSDILKKRFSIINTATVRHPIDQWLSLCDAVPGFKEKMSLEIFLHGYLRFAGYCAQIGFVRYEDFIMEPEHKLRILCNRLKLNFDPGFSESWATYNKITGDIVDGVGRGGRENKIRLLPRREINSELLEKFEQSSDYLRSLEILGYEHPEMHAFSQKPNQPDNDRSRAKRISSQGEKLFAQGDISGALDAFRKALIVDANFAIAHNNLGVLYWQAGKAKKASEHFIRALTIDPNDRNTIRNCGEVFTALNQIDKATNLYSSYLECHPDDEEIYRQFKKLSK